MSFLTQVPSASLGVGLALPQSSRRQTHGGNLEGVALGLRKNPPPSVSEPLRYRHENQADRGQTIPRSLKTCVGVRCAESGLISTSRHSAQHRASWASPAHQHRDSTGSPWSPCCLRAEAREAGGAAAFCLPSRGEESWLCRCSEKGGSGIASRGLQTSLQRGRE